MRIILFFLAAGVSFGDALDIVRESVRRDWRDLDSRRNYTFVRHTVEKEYSGCQDFLLTDPTLPG